ncbi:hypothetical transcript [Echinococcus multilocularis]|uniref:Hypothetical transcript n=1 Tax=Echinococcus multilocularis TaxID=6211 RepID=A0A068YJ27_ECHMU|nr:hypothetical transcript [Echinococcus multilocularis]
MLVEWCRIYHRDDATYTKAHNLQLNRVQAVLQPPSANHSGNAAANGNAQLIKSCQDEQWRKRLMVASGYTMEGVALQLGMTFIAINVYVCINLTHGRLPGELQATPDILPKPHDPYSSAENSAVSGPPDYETACREPQLIPNDDMIVYQPPSTSPPPLATLTSNNTPPKMVLKFYAGTLMVPKCHSHLLATSRLRLRALSSSALSMEV